MFIKRITLDDGYKFYTQNILSYLPKNFVIRGNGTLYHLNSKYNPEYNCIANIRWRMY